MQEPEIIQLWILASKRWPRLFELPKPKSEDGGTDQALMMEVWKGTVGDLDALAAKAAMMEWVGTFPPNPGELREAVLSLLERNTDSGIPSLDEAWRELTSAVSHVGYYGSPEWSHPVVAQAVEALGFKDFCCANTSETGTWRAQFRGFYESASKRWTRAGRPPTPALAEWQQAQIASGALRVIEVPSIRRLEA